MRKSPKSIEEWRPVHWHYHFSPEAQNELLEIIRDLNLTIDYQSSKFFILYVPKSKLEELKRRLDATSGVLTDTYESVSVDGIQDDSIQVSFYLTEK